MIMMMLIIVTVKMMKMTASDDGNNPDVDHDNKVDNDDTMVILGFQPSCLEESALG